MFADDIINSRALRDIELGAFLAPVPSRISVQRVCVEGLQGSLTTGANQMSYIVDIKEVEQLAAKMRERYESEGREQTGWEGMSARLQAKILPALIVAVAEEFNRGMGPEDVTNAVAAVMCDMIVNTRGLVGATESAEAFVDHASSMLGHVTYYLNQFMTGNMRKIENGGVVHMHEVGGNHQ